MPTLNRPVLLALLFLLPPSQGFAQTARELLLASGERQSASLISLSNAKLACQTDKGSLDINLDEFVRWGGLAPRAARPTLLLDDGSAIVAAPAWTKRGSLQLVDDQWRIVNTTLRSIALPRSRVRAVWIGAEGESPVDAPLRRESADHAGDQDRVWLASGDALAGWVLSIEDRLLAFESAGERVEIKLAHIKCLALAGAAAQRDPALAIGLEDGSLIFAQQAKIDGDSLAIELPEGQFIAGRPASSVCFLQPFTDRVAYLSDLPILDYKHTPYLGVPWPLAIDESLTGKQLQVGETRLLKGIAMHSASRVVYRLDGPWRRFEAQIGVDADAADARTGGSVVFKVYVARDQGFEPAYESPTVRSGDAPIPVSVDIEGAQAIALLVEFAEHGDQQDHADWLEARVVK